MVFNLTSKGATGCLLCLAKYFSIHLYWVVFNLPSRGATGCLLCLDQYPHRVVFNLTSRRAMSCLICMVMCGLLSLEECPPLHLI